MNKLFIEAKNTADIKEAVEKAVKMLPKMVGLITTAQHTHKLNEAKRILEEKGIKAVIGGQILGCDVRAEEKIAGRVDAFLYIGTGEFHPIGVAMETGKKVVVANPLSNSANEVGKKEIEKIKRNEKVALVKFLSAENVGILVSIKPGQNMMKKAVELKKRIEKKGDKNAYLFIADEIDFRQFENFPFIDCWVNTACPRIADFRKDVIDDKIIENKIVEKTGD